jgi:uncharacterized protein YndB with AHSA1/START domain
MPAILKSMLKKYHTTIHIDAPRERVWDTMLGEETYQEWTKPFNPTSRFEGDWSEGSKMLFVGSDEETGEEGGMVAIVAENRPHEFMSLEHRGMIDATGKEVSFEGIDQSVQTFENYTFAEHNGGTDLSIDVDYDDQMMEDFEVMWKEALEKLKALSESGE